jgi:nitrogen fixation-related uncharacterized protein
MELGQLSISLAAAGVALSNFVWAVAAGCWVNERRSKARSTAGIL